MNTATLWKSRAFALGINGLGRVGGEWDTSFPVGFRYHVENLNKLCKGFFPGIHKGVATRNGRNLCDPRAVVLPVKNDLVILEFHNISQSIRQMTAAALSGLCFFQGFGEVGHAFK